MSVEAASADDQAALEFPDMLKVIFKHGNFPPQLIFSVDETGLFWKSISAFTFIYQEETHTSGLKNTKDYLMLLLGGNAL